MRITLTAAQQQAVLHALQADRKPVAPFPASLLERGLIAAFDGLEAMVRRIVCFFIRLPKPS